MFGGTFDDQPTQRGRRGRILRRLGKMGLAKPQIYKPPPIEACYEGTHTIYPAGENGPNLLAVRYVVYKGMVVDFSINQAATDADGIRRDVARVDTKHGTVHRHQFRRGGPEERVIIIEIPVRGWEIVDKAYDEHLDLMHDSWEMNLRRWSGD